MQTDHEVLKMLLPRTPDVGTVTSGMFPVPFQAQRLDLVEPMDQDGKVPGSVPRSRRRPGASTNLAVMLTQAPCQMICTSFISSSFVSSGLEQVARPTRHPNKLLNGSLCSSLSIKKPRLTSVSNVSKGEKRCSKIRW